MRVCKSSIRLLVASVSLGCGLTAFGENEPIPIMTEASWTAQHVQLKQFEVEAMPVHFDFAAMAELKPGAHLRLSPNAEFSLIGTVTRVEARGPGHFSVFGRLAESNESRLVLSIVNDAVAGLIVRPGSNERYTFRYLDGGVHLMSRVDDAGFPECSTHEINNPGNLGQKVAGHAPEGTGSTAFSGICHVPAPVFEMVIVYTDVARIAAGGTNAIEAQVQAAVDVGNQAYEDSEISSLDDPADFARIELLLTKEVSYDEVGSYEQHRNRLSDTNDGVMDEVHTFRDTYGADMVSLFVDDNESCGKAYCTPSGAAEGFQVTNWTCAAGNWSFIHETGHLQGCAHNREDAGTGCNEDSYSYGHRFTGDSGSNWRTIMSYDTDPASYARIGHFSSPYVQFDGQFTGVPIGSPDEAYNAATIGPDGTARAVTDWRDTKFNVWVDWFGPYGGTENGSHFHPFNTVAEGVNAVLDIRATDALLTPQLWLIAHAYDETLTVTKPVVLNAWCGPVIIGQ